MTSKEEILMKWILETINGYIYDKIPKPLNLDEILRFFGCNEITELKFRYKNYDPPELHVFNRKLLSLKTIMYTMYLEDYRSPTTKIISHYDEHTLIRYANYRLLGNDLGGKHCERIIISDYPKDYILLREFRFDKLHLYPKSIRDVI